MAHQFLNQLDDSTKVESAVPLQQKKQQLAPKKQKPAQPWFQLPEQKCQCLDVSEASSDRSSINEPLGES